MSNSNFDFGLGDILQENDSGHTLARGGAAFLAVLFLVLSSITTFGFFSTYAAGIGDWAGPTAAPLVSGAIGVLCLDVAALLWGYVRSRAATSAAQMAIALVISVADLLLALASSALFIILSTSLETGVRDAAGQLTSFGETVNWFGVGVITGRPCRQLRKCLCLDADGRGYQEGSTEHRASGGCDGRAAHHRQRADRADCPTHHWRHQAATAGGR
jgi:hypothetical protein